MNEHKRRLSDLSWLEIAHVLAVLVGAHVAVDYIDGYECVVEYHYAAADGMNYATGMARLKDTADESAEHLIRQVFRYASALRFPGISLPEIQFDSKEDLELKLGAAGVDPEFSLTHRSG